MTKESASRNGGFLHKFNQLPVPGQLLLAAAVFTLLVILLFPTIARSPNHYLFGTSMDAIKNYYTFLYYVKFDSGHWFTGMNYPFGEHFTFPDTQPAFAYLTGFLNRHVINLSDYAVGIMNSTMLFSLALGGIMLFLVLRENLLPVPYAILAAGFILLLSPQHDRLTGHYGLAYTFIIPGFWYLIIRMFKAPKNWGWPAAFIAFTLLAGLLHTYFLITGSLFLLAYTFVFALQEFRSFRKHSRFILILFITALLPVILFQVWLSFTDPVTDRPKNPYGFFVFHSSFSSVFFPHISPFKETWQSLFKTDDQIWEGIAYVGLTGLLVLLLAFIKAGRYLLKGRLKFIFRPVMPLPLRIGIWAAVLVLFFSMAYPFRWGLQGLVDIISPLKQFRSLGRFAWIFYYVFSVFAAFYFYQLYRYLAAKRAAFFGFSLLLFLFLIWGLDAKINIDRKIKQMKENNQAIAFTGYDGNYLQFLHQLNLKPSDFQAIVPLPYFSIGSDKFNIEGSMASVHETFRASLSTGLPIAANLMSRTSVSHTMQLQQLLSSPLIDKEVLKKFPNRKPLLLLVTRDELTAAEQRLVSKGTKLFENERVALYELPLEKLASERQDAVSEFQKKQPELKAGNGMLTAGKTANIVYQSFDNKTPEKGFHQAGAITLNKGNITFFEQPMPSGADTTVYEASVWINAKNKFGLPVFQYKQFTPTAELVEQKDIFLSKTTEIFKDWVRASVTFRLQHPDNKLVFSFEAEDLIADDLLIRPLNQDVYFYTDKGKRLVLNNYPLQY
ncbi:MAG TPA: hypothetical protein VK927_08585 [Adhaeribacter sp.]|nr:hypothetical protein [Adhaeribacter sp.]